MIHISVSSLQTNSSLPMITKFDIFEQIASMHVLFDFADPSWKITGENYLIQAQPASI